MNTVRGAMCVAAVSALSLWSTAGDLPAIAGTVGDRAMEKTGFRLAGDAVYTTTNCTPRFGKTSVLDVAGRTLTLQMKDKSWDNTYFYGGCVVTNSSSLPGRLVLPSIWGKYHVCTRKWHGGPKNVVDVSNGRFYIRTKVDSPDCWTLRFTGTETVMGDAVTGPDASRYEWAGPVEVAGAVHFADDTNTEAGGWGCTLTGPLSGPENASIGLSRAFCLRLGSKSCTFAGSWNLGGGGNGTYRCRLDLLKGAAFSGSRMKIVDSDLHMDAETVFHLPPMRHASGNCLVEGGAKGSTIASLRKTGEGTLTLDTPAEIREALRLESGALELTKGGRVPVIHRLVCLPGTALVLNGHELAVDEVMGNPEIRGGGRLVARKTLNPATVTQGRAAETLERLRSVAQSRQFFWAWTESWVHWGGLTGEDWPRFSTRVGAQTGRAPQIMYYDLATVTGSREPLHYFEDHRQAVADAIRVHWRANRGIPVFSWHMDHPCCTNGFSQSWYRYKCREHRNVVKDILDGTKYPCGAHTQWKRDFRKPYESPRAWYFERLDEIAAFVNRLVDDDGRRIPVILRYEHECDGAWFWWGHTWCTPNEFVAFSRMTADYLREKCGRDNLLFAYTPDRTWKEMGAEGDNAHNFLSWYPGDAYTDVIGFDDYSIGKGKTPQEAEKNFKETLRKLRLVSAFAREHGKVAAITETGCKDANDDFWTCVLRLATAEGVDCAFVDTWGGPWTLPATAAGWADLLRFVDSPTVLTTPDADLQRAAAADSHVRVPNMADEVNPLVGAITQDPSSVHGLGKTFPGAATPCGMVQLSPDTVTGGDNGPGYSYMMKTIEGFSFTHLSGIGWYGEFGNLQVMPTMGPREFDREKACSPYSHGRETAKAGYYAVTLDRAGIRAEMTAAPRAGMLRFTYPEQGTRRVQIDLGRRIGQKNRWLEQSRQSIRVVGDSALEGEIVCLEQDGGWGRGGGKVNYTIHFRAEFSEPFAACGAWEGGTNGIRVLDVREHSGTNAGFFAEFAPSRKPLMMKAGLSFVSVEGARANLAHDLPDFDFDAASRRAHALWSDAFAGVHVTGGTADERAVFATALYHSLIDPRMIADVDGRYMGSDGRVFQSGAFTMRTVFSGWDVFRSEFPLLTLMRPDIVNDTVNSMIRWTELGPRDTLPVWDIFGCLSGCMIGNPIIPVIADAYEKGIRGFDAELAWKLADETSKKRGNNARGWSSGALSTTLEYCYDDWCMGKFAEMLGKPQDAERYYNRAQWYTNCWSSEVGWMRARNGDGTWLPWLGRKVHRNQGTCESNPWQQGWFVPHDVPGLMKLMGGEAKFADELESFFNEVPADFLWNDAYNHANEPVHHVAFMFPYCGKPWLTQKWTREICAKAYRNDVRGLCGNEDVGQMSAWYVLAASGLHPVCPGSGIWILTSPIFPEVSFRLDSKYYPGGSFTIRAKEASAQNRYIRSAKLNGQDLDRLWLTTKEVSAGGVLEFEMGPEPETAKFTRRPQDGVAK